MITYVFKGDKIQYRGHLFNEGELCVYVCVCVCVWVCVDIGEESEVGVQFKPLSYITNINVKANLILTCYSSQLSHNL
jgi:hypothetical protein